MHPITVIVSWGIMILEIKRVAWSAFINVCLALAAHHAVLAKEILGKAFLKVAIV
ncbi:MAG: hypothetical protein Q8T08_20970 [Ignavibacteria bacterium]|nr:hypothetical protein [Ignavibacteria bacterium]